jgi:energy-coupling factor transporter ATP-binding protein EcfA2
MITRLYASNFRCLVAFEAKLDSFGVLCGPNGAGKSSVFDAIRLVRDLASGDAVLGGEAEKDIQTLDFTQWLETHVQEFELDMALDGHLFTYVLHLEQVKSDLKPRVLREKAMCDKKILFERDLEGVSFQRADGTKSGFPLDWRQAALCSIQPAYERRDIELLQKALKSVMILRPSPRSISPESKGESKVLSLHAENLLSWYRHLSQEQEWTDALRDSLQEVWPDFRSFKLVDVGLNSKALQLRFEGSKDPLLFFHQLSDGEKTLINLYMVRAALETGAARTVLIDEPDNYVGLPELQPWVLGIRELLDGEHQALLISHHPEVLGNAGEENGRYLWRDNHSSPTRVGPLKVPAGLTPGEAIARGWVNNG